MAVVCVVALRASLFVGWFFGRTRSQSTDYAATVRIRSVFDKSRGGEYS